MEDLTSPGQRWTLPYACLGFGSGLISLSDTHRLETGTIQPDIQSLRDRFKVTGAGVYKLDHVLPDIFDTSPIRMYLENSEKESANSSVILQTMDEGKNTNKLPNL